jgi:hypothetical protein
MSSYKRKEVFDYLTRKPVTTQDIELARTRVQPLATRIEQPETDYQTEVQPDMVIPPQDVLPKNPEPVMPFAPGIPNPQDRILELATGGRVNFNEGSKLTGTGKTLEQNIKDDHKAFNDYRKSIGQPTIPLDNAFIRMWQRTRLNSGGRVNLRNGTETLAINPMLDNVNPNTIGGAAIVPTAGITAAAIADRFNISLEDAGRMLKRLYTGPEGLVIGGDRLTEEAKPDIEKFPSGEKPETSLITKIPGQTKKDTGFIPPMTDTEIPGLQADRGTDTSILYKGKMPEERLKKVEETYYELKKELKRIPSRAEISDKLDLASDTVGNYLDKLNLPDKKITTKDFNKYGNVNAPTITETGIKWPSKEEESFYINQIIERFKYPKGSNEYTKKINSEELFSNKKLSEKYNLTEGTIENINTKIIKDYKLDRPVIGLDQARIDAQKRKREVRKKYSDYSYEVNEISGTPETQLGHASDVFNIQTKPETMVYTPRDINAIMGKRNQADYVIRGIVEKQEDLIKNKPENFIEELEKLNKIGMDYAVQTKGYKVFEPVNLKTLERKPFFVDYSKTIDPTGIYKGKTIKEIAGIEKQVNKIKKKEGSLTSKEIKMLQDYELYEKNREAVLGSQSKIKTSEIKNIMKNLLKVKKPDYATGGRVKLQNGTEESYNPEIPSLGFSDPIDILEQQMINEKDPTRILALDFKLTQMKKRQAEKQKVAEEEKIAQKEKGVRYKEDFPSEADYFIETGKQLVTNPKYFYGKLGKGVVEGTEFLVGQPLQTLFSQEGKNFEFYQPVAGEKLGINKFIKENQPEFPTTGTLIAGDVAEIAGSVLDPFLAYGIVKGAAKASKTKTPVVIEETVDPTRRDLLKIGAVLTGGAIAYPTAKKLGLLETGVKVAKTGNAVRIATSGVVNNMPEFFPYLSEFSLARGKVIGQDYMRSGMTEFKRELTIPLEITTGGKKTNVKFEFIHNPAEGNVTAYYTNPLTDEKHSFDFYSGKQGKQAYGIDPEHPGAYEYYTVEVEPPGFDYRYPDKADPYRKNIESYSTSSEGDEVVEALDKWYKGLSKEEKARFENKFITHSEYTDEIPAASYDETENYPIMEFMYPKKKND